MTHPAIVAMARAMYEATPRNRPWSVEAQNFSRRLKWEARAHAALRALAALEPSEGMLDRACPVMISSETQGPEEDAERIRYARELARPRRMQAAANWTNMLAALVKEAMRDA